MKVPRPEHHARIVGNLRTVLSGEQSDATHARVARVAANRPRHHLVGVAFNAFARLGEGKTLTDFERRLVDPLRRLGFSDDQLAELGAVHAGAATEARRAVFPQAVAHLSTEQGYTDADFRRDAPKMVAEILAMPSVRVTDATTARAGEATVPAPPDDEFARAAKAAGWSLNILASTADSAPAPESSGRLTSDDTVWQVRATSMHAVAQSHDDHGTPTDEWYFGFATTNTKRTTSYKSEVMADIDDGVNRDFRQNVLWVGSAGATGLVCTVDCWEQDNDEQYMQYDNSLHALANAIVENLIDPSTWLQFLSDVAEAAALEGGAGVAAFLLGTLIGTAVAAALGAAIAAIINALTAWAADDHVGTSVVAITPDILRSSGGGRQLEVHLDGRGNGEGYAIVHLQLQQLPGEPINLINQGSNLALEALLEDDSVLVRQRRYDPNNPAQLWVHDHDGIIWNVAAGDVLDVDRGGTEDGDLVYHWRYNGGANQVWYSEYIDIYQAYFYRNSNSGKYLDVNKGSHEETAWIHQWSKNGSSAQRWLQSAPPATLIFEYPRDGFTLSPDADQFANGTTSLPDIYTLVLTRDGEYVGEANPSADGNWEIKMDTSAWPPGEHTLRIRAKSGYPGEGQVTVRVASTPSPSPLPPATFTFSSPYDGDRLPGYNIVARGTTSLPDTATVVLEMSSGFAFDYIGEANPVYGEWEIPLNNTAWGEFQKATLRIRAKSGYSGERTAIVYR